MDENKETQETGLTEESEPAELPDGGTVSDETPETEPDMVFGLPRRTFHLVVIGYALGVIAVGLLGLAGLVDENTGTVLLYSAVFGAFVWVFDGVAALFIKTLLEVFG